MSSAALEIGHPEFRLGLPSTMKRDLKYLADNIAFTYKYCNDWLMCLEGHGVCATERQSGIIGSTVHLLYSLIVHLVYMRIQTYSTAVSVLLAPKKLEKKKKKGGERKISLFIKPELLSNSNGDKHFSVSGSLQQSTSCRELFILFIQSVCT